MINDDDELWMRQAIELARDVPDAPFGAVILDRTSGIVVGLGKNDSKANPTLHGEIAAIHAAATVFSTGGDFTLFTTAEPCPMCIGAILWSGISRVVYGTSIPTLIRLGWSQIPIRSTEIAERTPTMPCEIVGGVLEAECDALFAKRVD